MKFTIDKPRAKLFGFFYSFFTALFFSFSLSASEGHENFFLKGDTWSYAFISNDKSSKASLINSRSGYVCYEDENWIVSVKEGDSGHDSNKISEFAFYDAKTLNTISIVSVPNSLKHIGKIKDKDWFYVVTKTAGKYNFDDAPLVLAIIDPIHREMERIQLALDDHWLAHASTEIKPGASSLKVNLEEEKFDQYNKGVFKSNHFSDLKISYSPTASITDDGANPIVREVKNSIGSKSLNFLHFAIQYLENNDHIDIKKSEKISINNSEQAEFNGIFLLRDLGEGKIQRINLTRLQTAIFSVPEKNLSEIVLFNSGTIGASNQNIILLIPNNINSEVKRISIPENSVVSFDKNSAYFAPASNAGLIGLCSKEWGVVSPDGRIKQHKLNDDIFSKILSENDDFSIFPSQGFLVKNSRPRFTTDSNSGEKISNFASGEGGNNIFSAFSLTDGAQVATSISTETYIYGSSRAAKYDAVFDQWKVASVISAFYPTNGDTLFDIFLQGPSNEDFFKLADGLSSLPDLLKCITTSSGDIAVIYSTPGKTNLVGFSKQQKSVTRKAEWISPFDRGSAHFIEELRLLFIPSSYGYDVFRICDTSDASLAFSIHLGATGKYAVFLPNGKISGSPGCEELINISTESGIIDSSVVLPWRNRPAEVLKALGGDPVQIEVLSKVTERWLKKLGNPESNPEPTAADIPSLSLTNDIPLWAKSEQVSLKFAAKPGTAPVKDVVVRVNGVDQQRGANSTDGESEIERTIKLAEGQNWIEAVAIDAKGRNSNLLRFRTILLEAPLPAKRFIVAMGVSKYRDSSMNLEFAAKDATDLSNAFKASTNGPTEVLLLTNDQVTRDSLEKIRAFLANATENDEVVAFCAGHGVLDSNLDYVYASHEFDSANPTATGIKLDDLVDAIGSSKSLKRLLLLDTCHAGQVGEKEEMLLAQMDTDLPKGVRAVKQRGMSVKPVSGLSAEGQQRFIEEMFLLPGLHRGINIIGASGGAEFALESALWNNGVFTATIIEALRDKKADLNSDTRISVGELRDYLGQRVSELTKGAQKPSVVASERDQDFDLIRVATTGRKTPSITEEESQLPPETDQAAQSTEAIIRDYYRAVVSRDEAAVQSFFAETVNYLSYGNKSKAKVLADHRGDWKRYSGSQFEVSNFVSTGPRSCQFILDYSLMQGERPRRGKLQMTATFTDSVPQKITSLQAKVISAK